LSRAAAVKVASERKDPLAASLFARRPEPFSVFPTTKQAKTKPAVSVVRVKMVNLSVRPLHPDMDFDRFTRHELESGRNVYEDFRNEEEISDADVWLGGETARATTIRNPASNGIYEVVGADNAAHKCAVLTPLLGWGSTPDRCLVVRVKDGAWCETNRNAVWVRGELDKPAFREWVRGLPKVQAGKFPSDEVAAISLDETDVGMATAPMRFHGDDGEVWAGDGYAADADRPYWAAFNPWQDRPDLHAGSRRETAPRRVSVLETTGRPLIRANHLYLPKDSHWVKLDSGNRFRPAEGSEPDRFLLWTNQAKADKKAFLQVEKTAAAYVVNGAARFADRNDLEEHLVVAHGLKVAKAREISALADKDKTALAAVKYAAGPGLGLSYTYPTAPVVAEDRITAPQGFADDILPTVTSSMIAQAIPDMLEQTGARERYRPYPMEQGMQVSAPGVGNSGDTFGGKEDYDPSDDVAAVSEAAQSGRKELFDTAAMAALVKHTKLRSLIEQVSPRMMRQVTDLGNMLAHMAWNNEEWTERYGRSDVGALEDRIRDLFDGLGDLYLDLREKTVAGDPDAGILPDEEPGDAADSDQ
jgi:hypothetical protein